MSWKYIYNTVYGCGAIVPLLALSVMNRRFEHWSGQAKDYKKSLRIPKGYSDSVNRRRTEYTMVKRKRTKGQTTNYKTDK